MQYAYIFFWIMSIIRLKLIGVLLIFISIIGLFTKHIENWIIEYSRRWVDWGANVINLCGACKRTWWYDRLCSSRHRLPTCSLGDCSLLLLLDLFVLACDAIISWSRVLPRKHPSLQLSAEAHLSNQDSPLSFQLDSPLPHFFTRYMEQSGLFQ